MVTASTSLRRCALLLLVAALITLSGAGPSRTASAGAADVRTAGVGALRICTNCASSGGDLSRYSYVILHEWEYPRIAALKASNLAIKVLVYKDMAASYSYACKDGVDDALLPAGVGYCAAAASHPQWFLSDSNGQRVQFCDYSGLWQMDVGNRAYQDAWLAKVTDDMKRYGFDGVVIDDANSTEKYHLCGRTLSKYPTEASYTAATRSFLARVGPALMSQGSLVLPNINFDCWETCFSSFLPYTSGAVREWWTKNGVDAGGQYSGDNWNWSNGFLRLAQQQNKIFLAVTYGPQGDVRSQRYARASFLLDWNGGPSALIYEGVPEATDPWSAEWTQDIGTPRSARYAVGTAWRRDYTGGTVLVNPSATAGAQVDLGGSYLTATGSAVRSVTLDPMTGLILRNSPTAPAAPPPPAPTISLTAVANSSRSVDLAWKRAASEMVDVYRNGAVLASVPNSDTFRDRSPRTNSAPRYRVCQARTTTCSAEVAAAGWADRRLASVGADRSRVRGPRSRVGRARVDHSWTRVR